MHTQVDRGSNLRNHRSVPQQTTSYATGQTVCTFISGYLGDGHAMIGVQCGCAPLVCVCVDMHSVVQVL